MSLYEGAEDAKRVLSADNMDQMALLFGALDENVETVQQRTGARIRAMGTEITVTGTQESGVSLSFRSVISAVRSSPVRLRFRS